MGHLDGFLCKRVRPFQVAVPPDNATAVVTITILTQLCEDVTGSSQSTSMFPDG